MKTRIAIITAIVSAAFAITGAFAQDNPNQDASMVKDFIAEENGWRITDYQPYVTALRDLEKLNKQYSENVLKLAIDEYSVAIDILEDMDQEIAEFIQANKEKINLNEYWYWQEIDRKNQEYRHISYKKREAKLKAVTYLTKSINDLDEVKNVELRNEPKFLTFISRLYQAYVATQYDIQNLRPCIPILERYIKISEKNRKDVWAYRYLASCYGFVEKEMERYKYSTDDEIVKYRNKKNKSLLTATELMYGVDSPHYKKIQEVVQRGERKSERLNDFK
ncbi:MAG: hypothetical protein LBT84_03980 [Spirochaetia bacterium]|jgi:hypothetical protein|nr:hypothetical protein [Spirochaetia bacterium]